MIRVLLADDQAIVRAGVARILSPQDGFDVVAECSNGSGIPDAVRRTRPDVVLMDVRMPEVDGIEATRRLRAEPDPPAVLVLTTFDDDDVLWAAVEAGAAGFVLKDATADDLIAATRSVAAGGAFFDARVTPRLLTAYRAVVVPAQRERRRLGRLSEREAEVLQRMAHGATNQEIAGGMYVSEATVKSHVGAIFAKLEVRDRSAAIIFAFDAGVVRPGDSGPPD